MLCVKVALCVAALAAAAATVVNNTDEKKVDLLDIENDNLKNENKKDETPLSNFLDTNCKVWPLMYQKQSVQHMRYLHPPQQRFHQYSVTEPPERPETYSQSHYGTPSEQANIVYVAEAAPRQIPLYLVKAQSEQKPYQAAQVQYAVSVPPSPEQIGVEHNLVDVPTVVAPSGAGHLQQYLQPGIYYMYIHPNGAPVQAAVGPPITAYQVLQHPSAVVAPSPYGNPAPVKESDENQSPNPVIHENQDEQPKTQESPNGSVLVKVHLPKAPKAEFLTYENPRLEGAKSEDITGQRGVGGFIYPGTTTPEYQTYYSFRTPAMIKEEAKSVDAPHNPALAEAHYSTTEYPRYYYSRTPFREEYRHSAEPKLPSPSPLLLKAPPPHLAHLPKALPMFRPLSKPVYAAPGLIPTASSTRPTTSTEAYSFKRRPMSLLDSYIPSQVLYNYVAQGYARDPLAAYEALNSERYKNPSLTSKRPYIPMISIPKFPYKSNFEKGFLPNQMYPTAMGGVTYGHYKRSPKVEKTSFGNKKEVLH